MDENKNRRPRPRRSIDEIIVQPAVKPQEPAVKPQQPAEKPQQPAVKPQQPAVKPQQPAAKPQQPAAKPQQPAVKPQEPAVKPQQPAVKPQEPAPKPKTAPAPVEDENEKTRLSEAIPKSKLKTEVRKEKETEGETGGVASGIFKAIIYMTVVLVVSVLLAYGIILVANDVFAFVKSDEAVEVVIPEDASVDDIAEILGDSGVIKYPSLFRLYAKFQEVDGYDDEGESIFIPGTYTVTPMKNYMQLLGAFQKQYTRETVWVTIPEGSTCEDIITLLVDEYGIASRKEFVSAINDYDYGMKFLEGLDELDGHYYRLEGYLFPDTYQFYVDSSAETVIYRMLQNFASKLSYIGEDYCSERLNELGMTLDEVVTLASMIEKEVKFAVDYDQVSSVFYNRLADRANFPRLDSDATTVYAIMMETGERPETLGATELAFESPYNTRLAKGMPPGAIANPGYEALYCAFYPAKTKYYYFVADNNGYNLYARTAQGHETNKAEIRKEAEIDS